MEKKKVADVPNDTPILFGHSAYQSIMTVFANLLVSLLHRFVQTVTTNKTWKNYKIGYYLVKFIKCLVKVDKDLQKIELVEKLLDCLDVVWSRLTMA